MRVHGEGNVFFSAAQAAALCQSCAPMWKRATLSGCQVKLGVIGCVSAGSTAQSCLRLLSITHPILLRLLNIWERRICRTCLFTSDCAVFSGFLTALGACEHSVALPLPHTWQLCQCSNRALSRSRQPCQTDTVQGFIISTKGAGAETAWGAGSLQSQRSVLDDSGSAGTAGAGLGGEGANHGHISAFHLAGAAGSVARVCWPGQSGWECAQSLRALPRQVRQPGWQSPEPPQARQPGTLHTTPGNSGTRLQALHLQSWNVCFVAWDALRTACLCKQLFFHRWLRVRSFGWGAHWSWQLSYFEFIYSSLFSTRVVLSLP